ncbi:MAG: uroporphyrinogen decarboxylase family protein [Phycisphaerae bacterium]
MALMTHMERMSAVLAGDKPDYPPVSFWYHFPPEQAAGPAAVNAHLQHLARYELDFLKIMNDQVYPATLESDDPAGLCNLPVLNGTEAGFGRQLDLIRALADQLKGKVFLITTVFNAWAVLRRLVMTPERRDHHGPPTLHGALTPADVRISELLTEDRSAVAHALAVIGESLGNFARRCIDAGADGIFMSVRDDWVNTDVNGRETYDDMVRQTDRQILEGGGVGPCNVLHVCGVPRDFDAFAAYPAAVINWADRAAGPAIAEVIGRIRPVVCGGVDNLTTLPRGTPSDVEHEVGDARRQAGDRPLIISAGCTFDPVAVPSENLDAMVRAARQ